MTTQPPQAEGSWIAGLLEHRVALGIAALASVALVVLLVMTPSKQASKPTVSAPASTTTPAPASTGAPRYAIPDVASKPGIEAPAPVRTITPATPAEPVRAQAPEARPSPPPVAAKPAARPAVSAPTVKPVVKSASQPPAAPATVGGDASGHIYFVQVGAYREHSGAQQQAATLLQKGWNSVVATSNKGLYVVRIGPVGSREAADKLRSQLLDKAKIKGFIVEG